MTIPRIQRVSAVLWPSFLIAGFAAVLLFAVIDPHDLAAAGLMPEVSQIGAYTIGFFAFWLLTASSSVLTCYFQRPCE